MSDTRQFCTFTVGGLLFGIDVLQVQEVIRNQEITRVPLAHPAIRGLINLRGQIVTALDPRRRFEMTPPPEGWCPSNVVVRTDEGVVSLLVDEIGDVLEVNRDCIERPPDTVPPNVRGLIAGVYKLNGRLLLELKHEDVCNLGGAAA